MDAVRHEFDHNRTDPVLYDTEPSHAGAALWARGLQRQIAADWEVLEAASEPVGSRIGAPAPLGL